MKCPFCGSDDTRVADDGGMAAVATAFVECLQCAARGPAVPAWTKDAAVRAEAKWSERYHEGSTS